MARQFMATLHRPRGTWVAQVESRRFAALGNELERQRIAACGDLLVGQRRQAVAAVRIEVCVVADADQRLLQQMQGNADHALPVQYLSPELRVDELANLRQRVREIRQSIEITQLVLLDPQRVITVLFALARIPADCLDVAVPLVRYANFFPGRGNRECIEAYPLVRIFDDAAALIAVRKAAAATDAEDGQMLCFTVDDRPWPDESLRRSNS